MRFTPRHRTLNTLLATTASIAWLAVTAPAQAQSPQAPTVAAGSIAITRQGATTVINQTTDRGIIDWRSFSIGAGEAVRFDQPGRSSVTLNRVTGPELSRIDGNLSANGQVWLANPNGVLIGDSGQVNVGGLLATTGRIDAAEFLKSGRAAIDQIGKDVSIANFGTVNIAEGGYAALAAASIRNEGVVAARKGSVALGAGKAVTVDFTGDKLITFQVTKAQDQAVSGDSMISVGGKIAAEGGTVLMSARAAKGVMDNVVNLKGHVVANSVTVDGGTVTFGDGGIVQVSGKIDASNAAGQGGAVTILGEKVGLMDGASVDASGALGGGTVLVGGDWQGKGPSHNATIAYVAPTASINVDATMAGDGGKAVVWADDSTRFNGSISARGGLLAGNGGRVETSGKRALDVSPLARVTSDGRAAGAKTGAWLLDPVDITISTTGAVMPGGSLYSPLVTSTITAASISSALINNDVTIQTSGGSGGNGDIVFESGSIVYSGATQRTLSLKADRDINIKSGTAIDLSGAAHNIILNAGATAVDPASLVGGIMVEDATIKTSGGYIWMVGGPSQSWAARASTDLNTFGAGVYLNDNVVIDAGAGSFKAIGAGRDVAGSNQYSHGFAITNSVSITANGGLSITGTGGSAAGDEWRGVNLISSTINVSTGDVTITGTGGATSGPGGGGASGSGVFIQAMTMNLGSGAVSITGTAGSGGTSEQNVGVLIRNSSALTGSGAMTITGVGGGATGSSKNYGVSVQGSSITLSGTGTVTLNGTRGVGENSHNIDIASGSSVISASGDINLIGTATSGGAVTANKASGVVIKGNVETADGVIKIDGKGGLLGGSNNDGVIPDGTIKATNAGSIEITGEASAGFGFAAEFAPADRVVTNTGDITIRTNSIYWYGSSAPGTVKSTSGSVKLQPLTGASSIGVGGAVGGLSLSTDFLNTVDGKIEIGRSDLSAAITIADGYIAPKDFKFVSDSGAINFLGAVGSNSGLRSLTIQNGSGTTSFGGAVGGGANPFTTINVSGALRVSGDVTSSGAQSYGGAVALASSATFATTNAGVTFAGPVDAETAGTQFLSTSLGGGTLSLIGGVGQSKALASLNISDPVALAGAIKTTGTQSYGGAVSILNDTSLSFSNLRFNAGVTGSANLNLAAGFIELSGGSIDIGSGTLSFAGGAYITSDLTIDAAATIFNTDTLNLSTPYSLTIASGDLTMSTGTGAGSLTSLTVSAGATKLGYKVTTSGSQSYGGTVTLSDDLDLTSTGVGGSISFGGAIDGAGKTLVLSTNGSAITLPTVTVKELSVTTIGGAVTQAVSATATVTTNASIDAGSGLISLSNSGNSIAELSLTTTNAASVNLSGTTELSNSDVASLSLTTTGSVTQSGPLKANSLSLSGAGGSYALTNSANEIHGLVANTGTVKIINSGASDLEIVSAGVTVTGDLTLTQLGSSQKLKVNGPIDLGSGAGSFTVDGTIEGSGTISGSGATLALSAGLTGSTVATTGGVTVSVVSGEFNVNGTLKTSTPPSVLPSPPSAPTTVSTPSQQSVASVPSTPTQSSQASQISQASSPSVASAPTASETPSVDKALEADTTPILIGNEPVDEVVGRLIVAIDPISSNLGNSLSPSVQEEEGRVSVQPQTQSAGGASGSSGSDTQTAAVTAQRQLSLVNATAVGALIPPSPPVVASTGAPLASASTIKLDPADTGGANGQVIARGGADSAVGVNVSGAASQAGGSTTLLPGLLVQAPRNAPPRAEPPLAEQPSAINEEVFLD